LVNAFNNSKYPLKTELNFSQIAYFIVSTLNGSSGLSKSTRSKDLFVMVINELCRYLQTLKQ
jgi:hypothetical protein